MKDVFGRNINDINIINNNAINDMKISISMVIRANANNKENLRKLEMRILSGIFMI